MSASSFFPMLSRLGSSILVGLACLWSAATASRAQSAAKPNVLFLFADDYCFEALQAFGDRVVETPNLDRLVARGTTFTHAYNMGSWSPAVCIASRTMLVTGRSVWLAQAAHASLEKERGAGNLWPQLLAVAGYRTYMTGKWHLPIEAESTFDETTHVRPGMPKDTPEAYSRPVDGQPDSWNPADPKFGGFWDGGKHWSEVTADDTIAFLKKAAENQDTPFFIYGAFNAPHDPRQAPQAYLDKYPLERVATPVNFLGKYPYAEEMGSGVELRDEKLAPFPRTEKSVRTHRREYYALITHLDAQIGRILAALDASGQAANTWIFFTADHGLAVGQHGLMGKQNMYDHSVRVPFIVAGPGVKAGGKVSAPIYLQDVMATTLDLAGVVKPAHVYFQSLLPFLRDSRKQGYYADIYGSYLDRQRALTHDGYKLILYPQGRIARLYRVSKDPHESKDLAGDPTQRPRMRELFARLLVQQSELNDTLDLVSVYRELAAAQPLRAK